MSYYIGTKSSCESYNEKVSSQLGFDGNMTSRWSDVRRHPSKSLFAIEAHGSITPDEGSKLTLVDALSNDWNPPLEDY